MNKELKKAIIDFIIEHENDFQLVNNTTDKFKPYIYDGNGEYLIGGKEVYQFIKDAINIWIITN